MRLAAIDIGSNTFLLTIIDQVAGARPPCIILDEVRYVRLQAGLDSQGNFSLDALNRAQRVLEEFAELIKQHRVDRVKGVATSATRQAGNGHEIVRLAGKLGIPVEIISGEREANLTFSGAHFFQSVSETHWVVDVGGGSTEVILGQGEQITWKHSFPLGCVRLYQQWGRDILGLRQHIREQFDSVVPLALRRGQSVLAIAVAGTAVELVRLYFGNSFDLERAEGFVFDRSQLNQVMDVLMHHSPHQLVRNFGVPESRADVLLHGGLVLDEFFNTIGLQFLKISRSGIRFGVLRELLNESGSKDSE
ncbi:MAG: hypothetical protein NZ480_03035 [Bdellovibrionaceae bacterium]|nr:hypothetical protein [Pseudobdellovibrionaceae bacterium]MDW8190280.1 hypothetical protein [Pseudobdellovibrionaceae bacterium]